MTAEDRNQNQIIRKDARGAAEPAGRRAADKSCSDVLTIPHAKEHVEIGRKKGHMTFFTLKPQMGTALWEGSIIPLSAGS